MPTTSTSAAQPGSPKKVSVLIKVGVALAIIAMYALFVVVGTNTFLPPPAFEEICPVNELNFKAPPETQDVCIAQGGTWAPSGYCDLFAGCQQEFEEQMQSYAPVAFTVIVVAGVVGVILSFFIAVESVAFGLLIGGVGLVLGSTVAFWNQVNDVVRFVVIGAILAFLIVVGWIKTQDDGRGLRLRWGKRR